MINLNLTEDEVLHEAQVALDCSDAERMLMLFPKLLEVATSRYDDLEKLEENEGEVKGELENLSVVVSDLREHISKTQAVLDDVDNGLICLGDRIDDIVEGAE